MAAVAMADQDALAELMRRHAVPMLQYAQRLSGDAAAAQDLAQDTWLKAWQQADRYQAGKAQVSTWLYRILHNRFIDTQRKDKRLLWFGLKLPEGDTNPARPGATPSAASDPVSAEGAQDTGPIVEKEQLNTALSSGLSELPPNQRAALLLKHGRGLSNPEVAQIIGVSVRAVESLQARAKKTLRNSLEHIYESS